MSGNGIREGYRETDDQEREKDRQRERERDNVRECVRVSNTDKMQFILFCVAQVSPFCPRRHKPLQHQSCNWPRHTQGLPGKESGKSTPGQGPKSPERVRPGVSKESEKSPKVRSKHAPKSHKTGKFDIFTKNAAAATPPPPKRPETTINFACFYRS